MLKTFVLALFLLITTQEAWSESAEDAVASGLQHIEDVLTEETDSQEDQGKAEIPYKALWPCCALCAAACAFWATRMASNIKSGFHLLPDGENPRADGGGNLSRWLVAAAVVYWVMPLVMLAMGFMATPKGGVPLMAYGLWLGFWMCHMAAAFKSGNLTAEGAMLGCWEPLGKAEKLFYAMLEHLDMATDAMFVGIAAAHGDSLTDLWIEAWQQSNLGPVLVPVIQALGFSGVALVVFTTTTYLPQLLVCPSVFVPFLCLILLGIVWIWVAFGVLPGLVVSAVALALRELSGLGEWWWKENVTLIALQNDAQLLRWLGLEAFAPAVKEGDEKFSHLLFVVATKVVWENGPQLWLQSAFMALIWGHLGPQARAQTTFSVIVSLTLSSQKLVGILKWFIGICAVPSRVSHQCILGLIAVVLFGGLVFLLWVVARVAFVFICPSHLWNLSNGCVDISKGWSPFHSFHVPFF